MSGIEQMAEARGLDDFDFSRLANLRRLTSGPGRLCEALGITRERDNGKDLFSTGSDLQVLDDGYRTARITVSPRIGISKSAEMPLRYVIARNAFIS